MAELRATYLPVQAQTALLAQSHPAPDAMSDNPSTRVWLGLLAQILETNPTLSSIGWQTGTDESFQLSPLHHAEALRRAQAPASAAFRLILSRSGLEKTRFFTLHMTPIPGNPVSSSTVSRADGATIRVSEPLRGNPGSLHADISLKHLSAILSRTRATPSTQLAIVGNDGRLLAASHGSWDSDGLPPDISRLGWPLLATLVNQSVRGQVLTQIFEGQRWEALVDSSEVMPGLAITMVMAAPHDEILAGANQLLTCTLFITGLALLLAMPLTWMISLRLSRSLRSLAETAAEIRAFRFPKSHARSWVREVDELALTMQQMCSTIQRFLDISARLAGERHYDQLLEEIVAETMVAAQAQGGVVYLLDESRHLVPMSWRRDIEHPASVAVPQSVSREATLLNQLFQELSAPTTQTLRPAALPAGLEWLGAWFPGQSIDALFIPLINRSDDRLGLLLLARPYETTTYDRECIDFVGALSGTLAITIEKQQLLTGRQALLDGVIRMIAGAIDARSPYTSAHCQRVPVIVSLLAEAVTAHPDSPFRTSLPPSFSMEALHLAAWLHDCGKLFVPDYVTDKSVKLEAVHNRIHEIRTRFEVLKRDAEILCWQDIANGHAPEDAQSRMHAAWAELDEEFAFVARCNHGDPSLSDADIARLIRIGERTWRRTLDDRLGISEEERQRKLHVPPRALPAQEHLLADRLEHLVGELSLRDSTPSPTTGTTLRPPRHRLNLGELYCLSVRSGTLTTEERYLINAHILGTIAMLSTLPFPLELANVPEIAGSHHEHMDGSGYPFGKHAEELSLPARIIAIADVYEALTATDRPYKPGKSIQEAIDIMSDMARRRHLDPDLFALFIKAGIPAQVM